MKRIISSILLILLLGVAVIAAIPFLKEKKDEIRYENTFNKIKETSRRRKNESKVEELKKKNKDCIGYLEIPDTTISYPIMQTKDNPDFYLNHDFNKEYSFYGTPYLSAYCDLKQSDNLIIYSHNINGKRMFGALEYYLDEEYCKKHKKIYFTTDKKREYNLFAVMSVNIKEFPFYKFTMARDEKDFNEFVEQVRKNSLIDIMSGSEYGEQLIMLVTCDNRRGDDYRIVVVGKLENGAYDNR